MVRRGYTNTYPFFSQYFYKLSIFRSQRPEDFIIKEFTCNSISLYRNFCYLSLLYSIYKITVYYIFIRCMRLVKDIKKGYHYKPYNKQQCKIFIKLIQFHTSKNYI